jgi:membrane-bound serine protease (ClpP class)
MRKILFILVFLPSLFFGDVVLLQVNGIIHPPAANYIKNGISFGEKINADLIIIELNTPGGLMTSMREITTTILNSPIPVAIYVSPAGSQAASAGFFILMSADLAIMAPGTNTGSAHPVGGKGEDLPKHLGKKIEEDASATIRTLAEKKGRNLDLAEKAVKNSLSYTETEALDNNLIDFIANSVDDILKKADGKEIEKLDKKIKLNLKGKKIIEFPMNFAQKILSIIANPDIAYLLMMLGFLGIYVEITHPGGIFPGVIGVLSLLLSFYALSVLPVNYAGFALILLGIILLILEIKVTSYGALAVGGILSFIFGSMILIDSPIPSLRISMKTIIPITIFMVLMVFILTRLAIKAHLSKVSTGEEGIVGEEGKTVTEVYKNGKVFVHGEYWNAFSDETIPPETKIKVIKVDGMKLKVKKTEDL